MVCRSENQLSYLLNSSFITNSNSILTHYHNRLISDVHILAKSLNSYFPTKQWKKAVASLSSHYFLDQGRIVQSLC
ncbi:uncharacterized protein EKO05_0009018 [Ascochyta rabiei]|uniref:uncharacterized protein n=1 Tax=Didymella rabiei TaxID=5454 RepID=UPI00220E0ABE|nr:uncharacterized protein EKO05_0009018 [Ascochyta rabiei]UPX18726.1 hypothetical protein EKO05_0009018 [Ascochyta rabiei]